MTLLSFTILVILTASVGAISLQAEDDVCTCKNWKEVYKSGDAQCGAGSEFYFIHDDNTPSWGAIAKGKSKFNKMVCTEFFEVLDDNKCVNVGMGEDEGTWCYVDRNCKKLNLGSQVPNTRLAWKRCKGDPAFRGMKPEELLTYAKEHDLWFAYLQKMSYPGSRSGDQGHPQIKVSDFTGDTYPPFMAVAMSKILLSGTPYFYDTNVDGTVPHILVDGGKFYEVYENPDMDDTHPGTRNLLKCIQGC